MDFERAKEINLAILKNRMAITMGEPFVPLPDVSLAEMLEATAIVDKQNEEAMKQPGEHTITMVCDPRGIAASYAFEHYGRSPQRLLEAVGFEIRENADEGKDDG